MQLAVDTTMRAWPEIPRAGSILPSWQGAALSFVEFCSSWPWRWVLGLPWAFQIRHWILSMWPSIEFNFGSAYLRPDNRRQKLNWTLTMVILPIVLAAIYDVLKESFK
jgi:hypothetical protein